jgi:hypothetical protein
VFLDPMRRGACGTFEGHLLIGDVAGQLPTGASLDVRHGIFRWQPPTGFAGTYRFVFIHHGCDRADRRLPMSIVFRPR